MGKKNEIDSLIEYFEMNGISTLKGISIMMNLIILMIMKSKQSKEELLKVVEDCWDAIEERDKTTL